MLLQEIILHTLFESGVTRIQDLERYVKDDVERHGSRLNDLEKKLVGAYREATSGGPELEDEGLFEDEDEDEAGVLALSVNLIQFQKVVLTSCVPSGDFADTLGMDYLGLRELGIADELGITNLTIPKKLLKGKRRANVANAPTRPASPPPPYPPPPPFIPITSSRIDDQIGLLRERYRKKLPPPPPPVLDASGATPTEPAKDEVVAEDQPTSMQIRMGPLGQIAGSLKGGGSAAPKKTGGEKKKGTGPGKKKKLLEAAVAQQGVIVAKG